MTIKAWYEVGQRDPEIIDPAHIASFLDKVEAEAREADFPVAANVEMHTGGQPLVLQFGVRPEVELGFASIITDRGSFIGTNGTDAANEVMYDYTGSEFPVEARDEIALAEVRRAVIEFATNNGNRCEGVLWRELT
ncbi:Imm1 family immunity protein [Actinokineospora bangkokensis]|uniref:Imm1 family immunity protein n=1 Tax=Actinokineospora bangkokensis TaxID=1193682 RepID=UPI001E2F3880|nr:Imm1 family immunity protein [Actinokineospora bangkokensis]